MIKKYKKVGTTFLGLSCLLGGVLAFTGCESYEATKTSSTIRSSSYEYELEAKKVEAQIKLTQTYNVNTVKLYNACIEMLRDYEKMESGHIIYSFALEVDNSDKPSGAGESGYISLKSDTFPVSSVDENIYVYTLTGEYWLAGQVKCTPTLYIEKGSSENTSILTIKPRWYESIRYSHPNVEYSVSNFGGVPIYRYECAAMRDCKVFERDFMNSIFEGVQNCIK